MKNLTGIRFGYLTATDLEYRVGKTGRKYGGYVCQCDCGESTWCRTEDLTHNKKTSCSHTCSARLGRNLSAYLNNTTRNGECMEWKGSKTEAGYGRVGGYPNHKYVHREVFNLVHGGKPEVVMHTCDNPLCINPEHLKAGTHKENFIDMRAKRRNVRGSRMHKAKFTEEQILDIRKKYSNGVNACALAKEYKVVHSTMYAICKRKTWSHI